MTEDSVQHILVAEDNPDDLLLLRRAFKKAGIAANLHAVGDGEAAVAYLSGAGEYADRLRHPRPDVIILDIKMPKKNGLEVLQWLKNNPKSQVIPTVMMSSSIIDDDVRDSYSMGANTFFVKPGNFDELVRVVKVLSAYWDSAKKPSPRP